ncbi:MAG: hypothetical protein M3R17_01615 [Bacteroidota bacterium]|nr:hypothetical protein [Bacteroidota bacterium]
MENYSEKVAVLSEQSLNEYIVNRYKYIPEIVEAAIAELQKRGRVFSEEELLTIRKDIEVKEEEIKSKDKEVWNVTPPVADQDAPEYYSMQVIRIFSVLFSVLFGSILMAMNLSRSPAKKGVIEVIIFGVLFTFSMVLLGSKIQMNGLGIILNFAGAYLMEYFFWNKYIGADAAYRKRSFWIPLAIGIAVSAAVVWAVMSVI